MEQAVPARSGETIGPGLFHKILRDCQLTANELRELLHSGPPIHSDGLSANRGSTGGLTPNSQVSIGRFSSSLLEAKRAKHHKMSVKVEMM